MNFLLPLPRNGHNGASLQPDLSACLDTIVLLTVPEGRLAITDLAQLVLTAIPAAGVDGLAGAQVEVLAQQLELALSAVHRDGMEARCRLLAQRLPTTVEHLKCLDLALYVCQLRGGIGPSQTGALLRMQPIFELSDSQIDQLIERHL